MASLSDTELKQMSQEERVTALGMRTEALTGKSLYIEFDPDAEERFTYPWAPEVDYNKRTEIDTDENDHHRGEFQNSGPHGRRLWHDCAEKSARKAFAGRGYL